jgi:hypothetical protein
MLQLITTDFIKNRTLQGLFLIGILFDLTTAKSIKHMLILFGLPYLTSIGVNYFFDVKKMKLKGRISEQYRLRPHQIKIYPK